MEKSFEHSPRPNGGEFGPRSEAEREALAHAIKDALKEPAPSEEGENLQKQLQAAIEQHKKKTRRK